MEKSIEISSLLSEIKAAIDESKKEVAVAVNSRISVLYWKIGYIINSDVLNNKRAEYGAEIINSISKKLTLEYGKGWSSKQLRHCLRAAETFQSLEIFSALSRELSWTHLRTLMYVKTDVEREFYLQMARTERWSSRVLKDKIDSMLFERTSISKQPNASIKEELKNLSDGKIISPDLVFRDPYFLNFLGLKSHFSERNLEEAILLQMEQFILELGAGFTFVERQKRMIIDGEDFKLDLLFYHRKLKRLIAIELKLGKFKAQYKGQMELYLRYLEKYEIEEGEESPLGLILCSGGANEQIELLQLEKSGIRVAEYLIELPPKEILERKLRTIIDLENNKLNRADESDNKN